VGIENETLVLLVLRLGQRCSNAKHLACFPVLTSQMELHAIQMQGALRVTPWLKIRRLVAPETVHAGDTSITRGIIACVVHRFHKFGGNSQGSLPLTSTN